MNECAVGATRIREVSLDLRWLLCNGRGRKGDYLIHICATIFTVLCLAKRSENLPYTRGRERERASISAAADVMFNELLVSQWTILILECASSLVKPLGARTCVCRCNRQLPVDLFRIPLGYIAIHPRRYSGAINLPVFRQLLSVSPSVKYTALQGGRGDAHRFISRDLIPGEWHRCNKWYWL